MITEYSTKLYDAGSVCSMEERGGNEMMMPDQQHDELLKAYTKGYALN